MKIRCGYADQLTVSRRIVGIIYLGLSRCCKQYKMIEEDVMGATIDPRCHIGETHGVYTIVDMTGEKDKYGHWLYKCVCNECGFVKYSHYGAITGKYKATTCRHLRANGEYIIYGYVWGNKRLKRIFHDMLTRCYNRNDKDYKRYGGKGVFICDEWLNDPSSFERWSMANNYDDSLTIDRIDANNGYCPENCRWIPLSENIRRAGRVNWITINNETLTGRQWAEKLGLGLMKIDKYLQKYDEDKVKELIVAILADPIINHDRKPNQDWFSVYGIQT